MTDAWDGWGKDSDKMDTKRHFKEHDIHEAKERIGEEGKGAKHSVWSGGVHGVFWPTDGPADYIRPS